MSIEQIPEMIEHILRRPQVVTDGYGDTRVFAPKDWEERLPRAERPHVQALRVHTLAAVVDYLRCDEDRIIPPAPVDLARSRGLMLHVTGHDHVEVIAGLEDEATAYRRNVYLVATLDLVGAPLLRFGAYLDAETFIVGLQAGFVPTPERDALVEFVSSIRESDVRETVDDGIGQEVKTARGVTLVNRARVPNPVALAPYRTFREIEQPESRFGLRLRSGPTGGKPECALFDADGGHWKLLAIARIGAWLAERLSPIPVPIIA